MHFNSFLWSVDISTYYINYFYLVLIPVYEKTKIGIARISSSSVEIPLMDSCFSQQYDLC